MFYVITVTGPCWTILIQSQGQFQCNITKTGEK